MKIREHMFTSILKSKSLNKCNSPFEQIETQPEVVAIKELSTKDPNEQIICFMKPASNVVRRRTHPNSRTHVLSITIGTHCYHGLCNIAGSISSIPFALYKKIIEDISSLSIERTDVVIQLVDRFYIHPIVIVKDVEVLCGRTKYPANFLVLGE